MTREWADKIFNVDPTGFNALALEIFKFQYENNLLYNIFPEIWQEKKTDGENLLHMWQIISYISWL